MNDKGKTSPVIAVKLIEEIESLTAQLENKDEEIRKAVTIVNEHRKNDLLEKENELQSLREQLAKEKERSEEWWKLFMKCEAAFSRERELRKDLLQRYTDFLQDKGYIDTDATFENPTAIERFLKIERVI